MARATGDARLNDALTVIEHLRSLGAVEAEADGVRARWANAPTVAAVPETDEQRDAREQAEREHEARERLATLLHSSGATPEDLQ